jgi:hypothetical protein
MSVGSEPAFPIPDNPVFGPYGGMTYRQWLIGQCIQGILANPNRPHASDTCGEDAISQADFLISELDAEKANA